MVSRRNKITSFLGNEDGAIAIIFGFACVVLVGVVGLSIDGGRALGAKSKTDAALDAAALAGTRALFKGMSVAEVEQYTKDFYLSNVRSVGTLGADYGVPDVEIDTATKTMRVSAFTKVPTTFGRIFGVDSIDFASYSTATFNVRDIELGMALDVTGSMRGRKIEDLKDAAKGLVESLIPDTGSFGDIKIALAPYSAAVNAGPVLAGRVTNNQSPDGCVFERDGGHAYRDTEPSFGRWLNGTLGAPAVDIDPSGGTGSYSCPNARVLPLTSSKNLLKTTIDTYGTGGWTAGHLGGAWAWYTISPEWSSIWSLVGGDSPRPYGTPNLIKAIVYMTDGEFNQAYKNDTSANQAIALCDNMKAQGVIVYSVAFMAPSFALDTLTDCASIDPETGRKLVYDAQNGVALYQAFQDIAIKLTNLRLSE